MVPKAELHVHLEGTATPELVRRLAERNDLPVPEGLFADEETYAYTDFLDFLRAYDLAAGVIRTGEDYRDVTFEYLARCAAEGAIYVELIVSPDHAAQVGLSDEEHLDGVGRGIDDARAQHGIEARMLVTAIRNYGVERAIRVARYAACAAASVRGRLPARGRRGRLPRRRLRRALPDSRRGGPRLQRARRRVGRSGERARRAHAAGHAHRPRGALDRGPGARRASSPSAARCSRCCPTSNVVLGIYPSYEEHPLRALRAAGVPSHARIGRPTLVRGVDRRRVRGLRGAARLRRRGPAGVHENRSGSRILRGKAQREPNKRSTVIGIGWLGHGHQARPRLRREVQRG